MILQLNQYFTLSANWNIQNLKNYLKQQNCQGAQRTSNINFIILNLIDNIKLNNFNNMNSDFFDNKRPRLSNPSFLSFNAASGMQMHHYQSTYPYRTNSYSKLILPSNSPPPSNNLALSSINPEGQRRKDMYNKYNQYSQHKDYKSLERSSLSKYGSNSLNNLHKKENEVDIYEKQQKRFNIITNHPLNHDQTIKKYPKLHLQNEDDIFIKRKLLINGKIDKYAKFTQESNDKKYKQGKNDNLWQQFETKEAKFRPKALNNADDLTGLL